MKRISKLLVCSLMMIFGILFYTDVLAGNDVVRETFTIYCTGIGGIGEPLSGCKYVVYKGNDSSKQYVNASGEFQVNEYQFITGADGIVQVTLEINVEGETQYTIQQVSPKVGYRNFEPGGDAKYTVTFTNPVSSNNDFAVFRNWQTQVFVSRKDDQNQEISGESMSIVTNNVVINKCVINMTNKTITYVESGGAACTWTTNGEPITLIGFPDNTSYVLKDNDTNQTQTFNTSNDTVVMTGPGKTTVDSDDTLAQRSTIYLLIMAGTIALGISLLIYAKKQKNSNSR